MVAKRSEPRIYPHPPQVVFNAALSRLPANNLTIAGADPNQGTIWADKGVSALSWGEKVTIYIYQVDQGQTAVTVDSALKFGLFSWGAHKRNHQRVFDSIDQGLAAGSPQPMQMQAQAPPAPQPQPYPQEQAPGPFPYQQQPDQQPQQAPPGATSSEARARLATLRSRQAQQPTRRRQRRRPAPARPKAEWRRQLSPYPTEPSICSSIRRLHSTAYSIGRVRVTGSTKPLTIMPMACSSERPRLIR